VLSPLGVQWLLPRFHGAEPAAKILAMVVGAASLEALGRNALVALGRQRMAALLAVGFGVLAVGLDVAVLRAGLGIEAVAGVALGTWTALGLALAWSGLRALDLAPAAAVRALLPPCARFAWAGAVLFAAEHALPAMWMRAAAVLLLTTIPELPSLARYFGHRA